jgi:hypothetical protein
MYAEFQSAIQGVKTLSELLKAAQHLSNYNELVAAVSEVNAKLLAAQNVALASQEKQTALAERVRELEEKVAQSEGYKTQLDRFQLHAFKDTGALAYTLKPGMERGEPPHYLCAACVDKRQISKLQPIGHTLKCPSCGLSIEKEQSPPWRPRGPRNPMTV